MKNIVLALTLFGALFFTASTVSAKGVILYSNGPKIDVVQQLPAEITINKEHVNLGVMYKQFSIFWIPIWNYGTTEYVLINDKEDTYFDVDAKELETLRTKFNVTIAETPSISFWNKIGGKILILALIAAFGLWQMRKG